MSGVMNEQKKAWPVITEKFSGVFVVIYCSFLVSGYLRLFIKASTSIPSATALACRSTGIGMSLAINICIVTRSLFESFIVFKYT